MDSLSGTGHVLHLETPLGVVSGDMIQRFPELRGITPLGPVCLIAGFTDGLSAALGGPCNVHFHEALVGTDDPNALFRRATCRVDGIEEFVAGEGLSFSIQAPRSDGVAPVRFLGCRPLTLGRSPRPPRVPTDGPSGCAFILVSREIRARSPSRQQRNSNLRVPRQLTSRHSRSE